MFWYMLPIYGIPFVYYIVESKVSSRIKVSYLGNDLTLPTE